MTVRLHADVEVHRLPGIEHRTLAGVGDGLAGAEVWLQTLAPGAETPEHKHDCEEVVVVLSGAGLCRIGAEEVAFGPDSTLIVPAGIVHMLRNTGAEPIRLVSTLSATPAPVLTPDGRPIPLPWSQR